MKARNSRSENPSQITFPRLEQRAGVVREPMYCRVTYTYQAGGSTYSIDGFTRDFSKIGCGIRGTIIPPVGSKSRLTVYLLDQKRSLSLDATITWVAGDFFGVQFPEVNEKDYTRIRQYMWNVLNR